MKYKIGSLVLAFSILCTSIIASTDILKRNQRYHQHRNARQADAVAAANYDASTYNSLDIDIHTFSTHLPIIHIQVEGQPIPAKEDTEYERVSSIISVYNRDDADNTFSNEPDMVTIANIKYRGRTSIEFDKKGFNFKFVNEDGTENHQKLLGMDAHDTWILHGPYLDKTLVRNYMWYNISGEIMNYAPNVRFCEVFVDDEYQGVYLAVEPITTSKTGRLNISPSKDSDTITSYLIELTSSANMTISPDKTYLNNYTYYTTLMENTKVFEVVYPGKKNITESLFYYIQNDISRFEKALYSYDYSSAKYGYRNKINIDSFIDYAIINEFTMNYDAGNLSTYIYKDPKSKIDIVVWDMNNSFGNYFTDSTDITEVQDFYMKDKLWFTMLYKDEFFTKRLITRYHQLRETYLNENYLNNYVDEVLEYLGPAIERNFSRWGDSFTPEKDWLTPEERNIRSFDDAISQYKYAMRVRGSWLDRNIESIYQYSHSSKVKRFTA